MNLRPTPLPWQALRSLTLEADAHPRGLAYMAAASGLVCAFGRAYVVADDEHHLAVFDSLAKPGTMHRLAPGDLPAEQKKRKHRKPDLETLVRLPPRIARRSGSAGGQALLALGSGSKLGRHRGWWVPLDAAGRPLAQAVREIDLAPLFEPLRARLGESTSKVP